MDFLTVISLLGVVFASAGLTYALYIKNKQTKVKHAGIKDSAYLNEPYKSLAKNSSIGGFILLILFMGYGLVFPSQGKNSFNFEGIWLVIILVLMAVVIGLVAYTTQRKKK